MAKAVQLAMDHMESRIGIVSDKKKMSNQITLRAYLVIILSLVVLTMSCKTSIDVEGISPVKYRVITYNTGDYSGIGFKNGSADGRILYRRRLYQLEKLSSCPINRVYPEQKKNKASPIAPPVAKNRNSPG